MNIRNLHFPWVLSLLLLAAACSPARFTHHPTESATLWAQRAAEYDALAMQIYRTAASHLPLTLEDSYWTALEELQPEGYYKLPPAVIMDVDETVLDNSAYQARMIRQGSAFDFEQWQQWVMEAQAEPVPGALEFAREAAGRGITVFYVTNREAVVQEGTRKNLEALGFPLDRGTETILSKGGREEWTSDKINRRKHVARSYRVLMLFGDDLNDFVPAKNISEAKRDSLVYANAPKWGREWHMLPNPVYGSWEQALYGFDQSLTPEELERIKRSRLETRQ